MTDLLRDRVIVALGELYDIQAELGRGGMSVVYRALDLRLHRPVAIKVLPPEFAFTPAVRERFLREAQAAAALNHPHIVPIHAVDERDGIVYYVMALVEGESLARRLTREPVRPADEARRVMRDVADALACAHQHGIIHRDVKPDNILIEQGTGRVLVTDFGIARVAAEASRLTATGSSFGTPAYMSPEQALGEADIDARSDIYSLGVVGYQMLAGAPPFTAANTPALLMKQVSEAPRPLRERRPDAPPELVAIVERALAKRAADRWPNAAVLREALESPAGAAARWALPAGALGTPAGSRQAAGGAASPLQGGTVIRAGGVEVQLPAPPYPMSPREYRRWLRGERRILLRGRDRWADERPIEERIRIFRRKLFGSVATVVFLAALNGLTTPWFPWFLFPTIGIGLGLVRRWGSLWADGVRLKQIFGRAPLPAAAPGPVLGGGHVPSVPTAPAAPSPAEVAESLVARDVLRGGRGAAVYRAADDRAVILGVIERLGATERALIPDVAPTVKALVDRIASLATTLHSLDRDIPAGALASLDQRLAELDREPEGSERDRRRQLLVRQRATLADLLERRHALETQLESAQLALGNLRLDLLRLRSSGLESAVQDVTSATQEARALSREIGHVLEAAAELRKP